MCGCWCFDFPWSFPGRSSDAYIPSNTAAATTTSVPVAEKPEPEVTRQSWPGRLRESFLQRNLIQRLRGVHQMSYRHLDEDNKGAEAAFRGNADGRSGSRATQRDAALFWGTDRRPVTRTETQKTAKAETSFSRTVPKRISPYAERRKRRTSTSTNRNRMDRQTLAEIVRLSLAQGKGKEPLTQRNVFSVVST